MISTKGYIGNIYINKKNLHLYLALAKELPDNSDKLCCGEMDTFFNWEYRNAWSYGVWWGIRYSNGHLSVIYFEEKVTVSISTGDKSNVPTQKYKAPLPTQLLVFVPNLYAFLIPGYRFPESKQIRERKLQRKKNEDSLNKHMIAAKVTADKLTMRKKTNLENFNLQSKSIWIRMKQASVDAKYWQWWSWAIKITWLIHNTRSS